MLAVLPNGGYKGALPLATHARGPAPWTPVNASCKRSICSQLLQAPPMLKSSYVCYELCPSFTEDVNAPNSIGLEFDWLFISFSQKSKLEMFWLTYQFHYFSNHFPSTKLQSSNFININTSFFKFYQKNCFDDDDLPYIALDQHIVIDLIRKVHMIGLFSVSKIT